MDSSDDTLDACNDNDATVKHAGQLVHRFVNNFQVHEEEQTRCGTCGDEKVCLRCSHVGKKECETCGIWISRAGFAKHRRIHTGERPFKCAQCLASFKQKHHLEQHLRRHSGEKPFLCEVCGQKFRQIANLRDHQATIHSTVREHECEQCEKSYKRRQDLMKHLRRVHGQVYSCREYNKTLPTRDAFTEHCLIHSGQGKRTEKEVEDVEDIVEGSSEESDDVKSEKIPE